MRWWEPSCRREHELNSEGDDTMNEATPIRRRQTVRLNEISDKRMNDQKLQGQYQL